VEYIHTIQKSRTILRANMTPHTWRPQHQCGACFAVCCSVLQSVAACCSVLQRVSVKIYCIGPVIQGANSRLHTYGGLSISVVQCEHQCSAVWCSVLQRVAVKNYRIGPVILGANSTPHKWRSEWQLKVGKCFGFNKLIFFVPRPAG